MKKLFFVFTLFLLAFTLTSCKNNNMYKDENLWVFKEVEKDYKVDTFLLGPAATTGNEDDPVLDFNNEKHMSKFSGAVKMQKGIYDSNTRIFAPYYREALLYVYSLSLEQREQYLLKAYEDVKDAFEYYLKNYNNGNKIIIAGFSEGANMALRLLKDYINNDSFYDKYVCCYAIGDIVDEQYLNSHERLKFATGETDKKVIISFNCESPETTDSLFVRKDQKAYCINPLSWSISLDEVDKSFNKGAVFLNGYGEVINTVNNFTGCYIDSNRGTLKVTDVIKEEYNSMKDLFGDGVFHLYDYQFFYNNLKENVIKRINN